MSMGLLRRPRKGDWGKGILLLQILGLSLWYKLRLRLGSKRMHELLKEALGHHVSPPDLKAPGPEAKIAVTQVKWAVEALDRFASWHRSRIRCLERALAARELLARRGVPSRLHLGVKGTPIHDHALAHAWLESDGVLVSGEIAELKEFQDFMAGKE